MKTKKEILVELRNQILTRLVVAEADKAYFEFVSEDSRDNSPEKVEALEVIKSKAESIKKDTVFLSCIDKLMKE